METTIKQYRFQVAIIGLTAAAVCLAFTQKEIKAYTQSIPGTDQTIEMVAIPGGDFLMGSPQGEFGHSADEGPQHEVKIAPFWMAKLETTWDLYRLFMERNIDQFQREISKGTEVALDVDAISGATTPYTDMSFGMGQDGYPVVSITQYAASKFCEWLSAMTGNFYRLPTEAEWEYACRAGSDEAFSFGSSTVFLNQFAWHAGNSNDAYHQVGLKKPNAWGLHDMHGNVAEWTLDQYVSDTYSQRNGTVQNPWEEAVKTYPRVVRGGSWKDYAIDLRSASRLPSKKGWKARDPQIPKSKWWHTDAPFVGFRIVRPVETPPLEMQKKYWGYREVH